MCCSRLKKMIVFVARRPVKTSAGLGNFGRDVKKLRKFYLWFQQVLECMRLKRIEISIERLANDMLQPAYWDDDTLSLFIKTFNHHQVFFSVTDHIGQVDLFWRPRQPNTSAWSPLGFQITQVSEQTDHLHQVVS